MQQLFLRCIPVVLVFSLFTIAYTEDLPVSDGQRVPLLMRAPAGDRYVEINPQGETILPNGRKITPKGHLFRVQPHPYGLALSPDGRWLVTASSGGPQLSILDLADSGAPVHSTVGGENVAGILDAVFMGLGFSPDSGVVYVAGGSDWSIMGFDMATRERICRIACDHESGGERYLHGYVGDLRVSPDGSLIYAVDQSNFRLLVVDITAQKVLASIPVGRYPFGITLSPDGKRAYVANVGMYEYSFLRDVSGRMARLHFPPYGVPSKDAEEGVVINSEESDGKEVHVPGLGDPNDIRAMSVWTVDVSVHGRARVVGKTKTGHLVGEKLEEFPAVGGSSPNSLVATEDYVYVSNGSNDSITVIDARTVKRIRDIDLEFHPEAARLRGMIPFGLALSSDRKMLYVAEAGINAVGVISVEEGRVLGHIPTAWFPSKLAVSPDGKRLYVTCAKGLGSGPNDGPNHNPEDPTGIGDLMRGYVVLTDIPETQEALDALTAQTIANNVSLYPVEEDTRDTGNPVPPATKAWESPIKHVIYITKENRTYDEVFGAWPKGRGDAAVCRLGKPIEVSNKDNTKTVKDVVLMPNHLALAKRFSMSDNYYCDSDHSVDGHRWLVGVYPNEFMECRIGESAKGMGPGNHAFVGSSGAVYPEDYNEGGAIWEHFDRNGIHFRNFGLGFEFKPQDEEQAYHDTGIRLTINYPMPKALFENTSRQYATYNTDIPDQFRFEQFEREYRERWLSGKEPFPDVITLMLPNDHGAGERPEDGYPFWGSYMCDNDLALGRLVELISHGPYWKDCAIFVTEDDAQGYRDSVDAHRSICMVISPYAQRDYVSSRHTSMSSILKTMFLILGLPALNQYDGFASDLSDMFTTEPENAEPYNALPVNAEVFDPQQALDPFDAEFNWRALEVREPIDNHHYLDTDPYGQNGPAGHTPR
ncbi:MAG: Phosphoesterase family protein [Candidatus Hydrogenedentes bacterium ADurb.Bin101]|nr:MAG: Phosphoesterase family protein [Candidatus Hydrogenedentes bacterium ADurb.Bin101]